MARTWGPVAFKIDVDMTKLNNLSPWAQRLRPNAIKIMQEAFSQSLPTVKNKERVRTGFMRSQTIYQTLPTGAKLIGQAGYTGFQNFGTRYFSGTHFMDAGVDSITANMKSKMSSLTNISTSSPY